MLLFTLALLLPYALFLLWLVSQNGQGATKEGKGQVDASGVTLVIPVRNEEENLKLLLPRLAREARSCDTLLRVILVDDHSTDATAGLAATFLQPGLDLKYIPLLDATGKKAALLEGIQSAGTEYILTIDGDCLPVHGWLRSVLQAIDNKQPDLLILPLTLTGKGLFAHLQTLEFGAIMAVTEGFSRAGLPLMCNGANMAFSRDLWLEFDARRHDRHIPSGDDMFLLHFAQSEGYLVTGHFSRNAFVTTAAVPSPEGFLAQRMRWAGKWGQYRDLPTRIAAVIAWVFHLVYIGLFYSVLSTLHFDILAFILIFKWMPEALLILQAMRKAGRPFHEGAFLLLQFLYSPYVVLTGLLGVFGKGYRWKDRQVRNIEGAHRA